MRQLFFFLARLGLSSFFLVTGIQYLFEWEAAEQSLINALYSISEHSVGFDAIVQTIEKLLPVVPLLLMLGIGFLLIGGLLVLLGIRVRLGAFLLLAFLVPATLVMHHFWVLQGTEQAKEMDLFFRNTAIFGGLVLLILNPRERGGVQAPVNGS